MRRFFVIFVTLILAGCVGNTVSSLQYQAPVTSISMKDAVIASVEATDQRKEAPHRLATIMGGFGNPLKTLDTDKPVKDEVADAFIAGLNARGLMGASSKAPLHIALTVHKFDADMIVGRTARIDLTLNVINPAGQSIYQDHANDSESETKFFETGVLANIGDLKRLCEVVLTRTVNRMLDKPEFRAALKGVQESAVR